MQNNKRDKKLVYILPEAAKNTHMKYNVEFLKDLSKDIEIFLILERGLDKDLEELRNEIGVKHIHYTGGSKLLRIPKLKWYLLQAWLKGFRNVYVHYSFVGAFYASLFPFMKVYYWNCGIPWQYKRPFFQELYESLTYKLIDHFVTGANVLVEQYAKFYNFKKEKGIVIPNWIDVKEFTDKVKSADTEKLKRDLNIQNQKVLFFNQRLAERKGAHYIPEILKSANKNEEVVMIITNDGPYKEKLVQQLQEYNLLEKVRMLGRVPNDKVAELLSITDIYVLPSEEEGMSHSLMEAFCASVASVSFDVGGTIDMYPVHFKDFVVPEKKIEWFNEKVWELLIDEEKRKSLGAMLYEKVKEYDKKIVLEEFKRRVL